MLMCIGTFFRPNDAPLVAPNRSLTAPLHPYLLTFHKGIRAQLEEQIKATKAHDFVENVLKKATNCSRLQYIDISSLRSL